MESVASSTAVAEGIDGPFIDSSPVVFEHHITTSKRIGTPVHVLCPPYPSPVHNCSSLAPLDPIEHLQGMFKGSKRINGVPLADCLPEDFELAPSADMDLITAFKAFEGAVNKVINHEFVITDQQLSKEQKRALNGPFIVGLHHAISMMPESFSVLIVGAGHGDDMERIQKTLRHRQTYTLDMVEPDEKKWINLIRRREAYRIRGKDYHMTFEQFATELRGDREYDLILLHYSLQHVMRSRRNMTLAFEYFARKLAPNGRVIACLMDPGGSMLLGEPDANSYSPNLRVLNRLPPTLENEWGSMVVQVGAASWVDPVINYGAMFDVASLRSMVINMMPGRETAKWQVPAKLREAFHHPDMRAVMFFEIFKLTGEVVAQNSPFSELSMTHNAPPLLWIGIDRVDLHNCVANKGVPVQGEDVSFLRNCEYLISEKSNGVAGMLYIHPDSEFCYLTTGRLHWKAKVPRTSVYMICQVEVLTTAESLNKDSFEARIVALDPVRSGKHPVVPFYGRYLQFAAVWRECGYSWIGRKPWYPMTVERYDALWQECEEGLVIQEAFAPPGVFAGVGTCRYVKKKITVDLAVTSGVAKFRGMVRVLNQPDGIYEFEYASGNLGKVIRRRFDKTDPNLDHDIWRLDHLVCPDDVRECVIANAGKSDKFFFREICPKLCGAVMAGSGFSELGDELLEEIRHLGLTYRGALIFPDHPEGGGEAAIDFEYKREVLNIRYEAYRALWNNEDLTSLAQKSSASLSNISLY